MPSDAERCREHAKECRAWAAGTRNPSLKDSLTDLAKRWTRLATELEATRILFEEVGRVPNATRETGAISMKSRTEQWRGKLTQSRSATNDGRP
jgi:hypothetical protein